MQVKASDLKRMAILSIEDAAKVAVVEDVLLDPETSKVVAFIVSSERFTRPQILEIHNISNLGSDAITLNRANVFTETRPTNVVSLYDIEKVKVITTAGTYLGKIHDIVLETESFQILEYVLTGTFWEGVTNKRPSIPRSAITTFSSEMIMVEHAAVMPA